MTARRWNKIIFYSLLVLLAGLYLYGAYRHAKEVNTDSTRIDQSAYMNYAIRIKESRGGYIGDRNRMPFYPYIQSILYQSSWDEYTFFVRGKYLNIVISLAILFMIGLILSKAMDRFTGFNILLISAFSVFIFKAGYFQAEILFYFLAFLLFLACGWMIARSSRAIAVAGGVIAGLAHLTKASILPGVIIFVAVMLLQFATSVISRIKQKLDAHPPLETLDIITKDKRLFMVVLFIGFYLITVFPYLQNSKERYSQYFYNVNSTFYFWYDSWKEAVEGTRAAGDRLGWPDLPAEEIPSMTKYLQEHSIEEIVGRLSAGSKRIVENVTASYGYGKYIVLLFLFLTISVSLNPQQTLDGIRSQPFVLVFSVFYLLVYFLLYAWYTPIAQGNRLILALFLPIIFSLGFSTSFILRSGNADPHRDSRNRSISSTMNLVLLMILVIDIYSILSHRLYAVYGGF